MVHAQFKMYYYLGPFAGGLLKWSCCIHRVNMSTCFYEGKMFTFLLNSPVYLIGDIEVVSH